MKKEKKQMGKLERNDHNYKEKTKKTEIRNNIKKKTNVKNMFHLRLKIRFEKSNSNKIKLKNHVFIHLTAFYIL